jgi:hypothetical protein
MKLNMIKVLMYFSICISFFSAATFEATVSAKDIQLKFRPDGYFKIVQFTDIQDGPDTDQRTIDLMNKILDCEKPDLVLLTGDNIDGRCKSSYAVKRAIYNIAQPMEKKKIPWAVVFGNHDDEHGQMTKKGMMKLYMSYPYNISSIGPKTVEGIGNYNILINNSKNDNPAFNIYMLDSGKYGSSTIGGYDWIKFSQIQWYRKTAESLKEKSHSPIPSLMFFHIPIPEFKEVWNNSKASGSRNENESCSYVNSGLFASLLEIGDVKGVFVGHDHTNDYIGELYGIKLGYSRNIGYSTYGKDGFSRGGRVFLINENEPGLFKTWMRLASDF